MKAGVVRWHYAYQMGNSSADERGWVINPDGSTYRWDESKINSALGNALDAGGAYAYNPVKMMNIVNWPAALSDSSGRLRTDKYDEYAAFCAQLVRIININQGRSFTHWEVFNELENGPGSLYDGNMAEVGRIYNKVAAAMKAVDPSIKVGGPAFARPDLSNNINDFFSVAAPNLDFVSYHTYATGDAGSGAQSIWNTAADWGGFTTSIRDAFTSYSSRSIEYYHDEFNISWNPPDERMNTIVGGVFDALAIVGMVNAGATGALAWNEADGWYGKLGAEYERRPASFLYQYLNEDMKGAVVSSSSSDTSKVVVLAIKNGNKNAFMLINRSEATQTIQLSFNGLSAGVTPGSVVTTKRVSASGGAIGSVTIGTLTSSTGYTLPANTITVLSVLDAGSMSPTGTPAITPTTAPTTTPTIVPTTTPTIAPTVTPTPTVSGVTGSGLRGDYYNTVNLSGPVAVSRIDPTVNFAWGSGSPGAGIGSNNISVRWTGQVQAAAGGNYRFMTTSDDGIRLWVNAEKIIDNWTDHAPTTNTSAVVVLTAGQKYDLLLEYYERGGGAVAQLLWTLPDGTQQVIPQSQLYPSESTNSTPTPPTATPVVPTPTTVPQNGNLLRNPGFENGLTDWGGGNGTITSAARSGTAALQVSDNGGFGDQAITGSAFTPGATYTLSAWGKHGGGDDGSIVATYWAGSQKIHVYLDCPGETFTACSATFTLPNNATSLSIGFWNNWGTLYYDDIRLVRQ